jgi:hypothetical protein
LNEQETKAVITSEDVGAALSSLVTAAPSPVQAATAVIAAYIGLEKSAAAAVDQGNGDCFLVPWAAIVTFGPLLVIPTPNGAPPPLPLVKQQHVNYIGQDGKVHELWSSDSVGWKHNPLSDLAGADNFPPFARSALDGYATLWNSQQHVNYIGQDGKVHELWYSGSGGWKHNPLSELAIADAALPAAGSPLDGYATLWNNQQHVNYIGQDGKVYELWYSASGGWKHNPLSDLAGADAFPPLTGSALDGYVTPWNNQQHVNYVGRDGKVHELWYSDNGGWKHDSLSDLAGADAFPPLTGSALDGYVTPWNNQQHIHYIGQDGKIHELWYPSNGGWKHNSLSDLAGADASLPASGSALDGYATPWNNQQHLNYMGRDGKVHELWYSENGGWKHNALSDLAGADAFLPLPGSALDGYVTPWNNQQHMNYIGQDGKVHELWYSDNGGWKHNILSDLAGADAFIPASGSRIDGYMN